MLYIYTEHWFSKIINWLEYNFSSGIYMLLLWASISNLNSSEFFSIILIGWFPSGISGNEPAWQCRRHKSHGLIPRSKRTPGGGHGNSLQYSCSEHLMDRGAWWVTFHIAAHIQGWLKWLSMHAHNGMVTKIYLIRKKWNVHYKSL